jgi:hypothetical protein
MPGFIDRSHLLSTVLGIITVLAAGTAAKAQSTFDGLWRVQIVSQAGVCGQGYVTYPVRIVGGVMQNAGSMSFAVSGQVDRRGAVRVSLSGGGQSASGVGRLSRASGTGQWFSPTIGCSGFWTAARQG